MERRRIEIQLARLVKLVNEILKRGGLGDRVRVADKCGPTVAIGLVADLRHHFGNLILHSGVFNLGIVHDSASHPVE
mgnify:CR=1 FL=1